MTVQCSTSCAVCGSRFEYVRATKPRITCSLKCYRRRLQDNQNEARRVAKERKLRKLEAWR